MFPIQDINHRIIGFGGRLTNDAKKEKGCPKYLNSPETRVFDKSSNLYGLNFAKDTKEKEFILQQKVNQKPHRSHISGDFLA